jgi:hypothetical protein
LCVDCAEDDARKGKTDSERDTHADRTGDQGAGVGCGGDIAEERDGDCAGGQEDKKAEDEGFVPEQRRQNLAEQDLVVRRVFLEIGDVA